MRVVFSLGNPSPPSPNSSNLHLKSIKSICCLHESTFSSSPLTYILTSYMIYKGNRFLFEVFSLFLSDGSSYQVYSPLVHDIREINFMGAAFKAFLRNLTAFEVAIVISLYGSSWGVSLQLDCSEDANRFSDNDEVDSGNEYDGFAINGGSVSNNSSGIVLLIDLHPFISDNGAEFQEVILKCKEAVVFPFDGEIWFDIMMGVDPLGAFEDLVFRPLNFIFAAGKVHGISLPDVTKEIGGFYPRYVMGIEVYCMPSLFGKHMYFALLSPLQNFLCYEGYDVDMGVKEKLSEACSSCPYLRGDVIKGVVRVLVDSGFLIANKPLKTEVMDDLAYGHQMFDGKSHHDSVKFFKFSYDIYCVTGFAMLKCSFGNCNSGPRIMYGSMTEMELLMVLTLHLTHLGTNSKNFCLLMMNHLEHVIILMVHRRGVGFWTTLGCGWRVDARCSSWYVVRWECHFDGSLRDMVGLCFINVTDGVVSESASGTIMVVVLDDERDLFFYGDILDTVGPCVVKDGKLDGKCSGCKTILIAGTHLGVLVGVYTGVRGTGSKTLFVHYMEDLFANVHQLFAAMPWSVLERISPQVGDSRFTGVIVDAMWLTVMVGQFRFGFVEFDSALRQTGFISTCYRCFFLGDDGQSHFFLGKWFAPLVSFSVEASNVYYNGLEPSIGDYLNVPFEKPMRKLQCVVKMLHRVFDAIVVITGRVMYGCAGKGACGGTTSSGILVRICAT